MDRDRGDLQLSPAGALVECLDVLKHVLELIGRTPDFVARQRVEHEGIIGVGRMSESQQHDRDMSGKMWGWQGSCGCTIRHSVDLKDVENFLLRFLDPTQGEGNFHAWRQRAKHFIRLWLRSYFRTD